MMRTSIYNMFGVIAAVVAMMLFLSPAALAEPKEGWLENPTQAFEQAEAADRTLLMEFTGSDWCPPCKMMKARTLDTDEFKAFAKDNLVLLELDFPRGKPQSEALKKQNEELARKYGVEGFPTFILFNPDGKELGRHVGYLDGGPEAFIAWINSSR